MPCTVYEHLSPGDAAALRLILHETGKPWTKADRVRAQKRMEAAVAQG